MVLEKIEGGEPDQSYTYLIYQEKLLDGTILIKAKNGNTGRIDFEGTDAGTVIQLALNAPITREIVVKEGAFEFKSKNAGGAVPSHLQGAITIPEKPIRIRGMGYEKTIFKWTGAKGGVGGLISIQASDPPIYTQHDVIIEDLTVDCNNLLEYGIWANGVRNLIVQRNLVKNYKAITTVPIGIVVGYFNRAWIKDNIVVGVGTAEGWGICLTNADGEGYGYIINNYVENTNVGIFASEDGAKRILVSGNSVTKAVEGIRADGSSARPAVDITIFQNHLRGVTTNSIKAGAYLYNFCIFGNIIDGGSRIFVITAFDGEVSGNILKGVPIWLESTVRVSLVGNHVRESNILIYDGCDQISVVANTVRASNVENIRILNVAGGTLPSNINVLSNIVDGVDKVAGSIGIRITAGDYALVSLNRVFNTDYGIRRYAGTNIKITENDIRGNNIALSLDGGSGIVARNVGYTTENIGTATILSGATSVVVAHGLAGIPKVAKHCPRANLGAVWVSARDATNITLNVATAPTADTITDWEVEM